MPAANPENAPRRAHPRPWMLRDPGQCAWPIGEGAMLLSCCAPAMTLGSGRRGTYCPDHWRVMWQPGTDANADREMRR